MITKIITLFIIGITIHVLPLPAYGDTAKEIIQKVIDRYDGTTRISKDKFKTCRYKRVNSSLACAESPRIKITESIKKDYGKMERDHKSITIISAPPGEKGVGFLQFDYDDENKDTDQWMYLSAFRKVKRLVGGSKDSPKESSFFGTEFSVEDLEAMRITDYTYEIVSNEVYQKRPCFVIVIIPTQKRYTKSSYSKKIIWVDKEKFITLKTILYDKRKKRVKRITLREIEKVNNVWIARKVHINNLQTKRMTTLTIINIAFNMEVADGFLTKRTLTDSTFREKNLARLRKHIKE